MITSKEPKRVVFGRNNNETALTADITDERRQALAFNVLYHMIDQGASIKVDGKDLPLEKDRLWLAGNEVEKEGDKHATVRCYEKPGLDPELFGANKQGYDEPNGEFSLNNLCNDGAYVKGVVPNTGNYEKANEMMHFMLYGIADNVSIFYPDEDGKMHLIVNNGRPSSIGIQGVNDEFITERYIKDWTTSEMPKITDTLVCNKKYELVPDQTMKAHSGGHDTHFVHDNGHGISNPSRETYRIRALRDFSDVKAGDLGGYVESEKNLSHDGDCWVYDDAAVCCDAVVKDNAKVKGTSIVKASAIVSDNAVVYGDARIKDYARVCDNAKVGTLPDNEISRHQRNTVIIEGYGTVSGSAEVVGEVVISENARVSDNAKMVGTFITNIPDSDPLGFHYYTAAVSGNAVIDGNAQVANAYVSSQAHIYENAVVTGSQKAGGHAEISGNAQIFGNAKVTHNISMNGNAKISGNAEISQKVTIGRDADIRETGDYYSMKGLGKNSYAVRNSDNGITIVHKGKSYGSVDDLKAAVGPVSGKGVIAIDGLERHFEGQMAKDLEEGLASLEMPDTGMKL